MKNLGQNGPRSALKVKIIGPEVVFECLKFVEFSGSFWNISKIRRIPSLLPPNHRCLRLHLRMHERVDIFVVFWL